MAQIQNKKNNLKQNNISFKRHDNYLNNLNHIIWNETKFNKCNLNVIKKTCFTWGKKIRLDENIIQDKRFEIFMKEIF